MMTASIRQFLVLAAAATLLFACGCTGRQGTETRTKGETMTRDAEQKTDKSGRNASTKDAGFEVQKSEEQWRQELTEDEYEILRQKGTEPRYTGTYVGFKKEGTYLCAGCGNPVFSSEAKYDSGTGWPSFYRAVEDGTRTRPDKGWIMTRTEVICARCGGHLGHVFDDGPNPTGLRYCINSVALDFSPAGEDGE